MPETKAPMSYGIGGQRLLKTSLAEPGFDVKFVVPSYDNWASMFSFVVQRSSMTFL